MVSSAALKIVSLSLRILFHYFFQSYFQSVMSFFVGVNIVISTYILSFSKYPLSEWLLEFLDISYAPLYFSFILYVYFIGNVLYSREMLYLIF